MTTISSTDRWFTVRRPNPRAFLRLFCFHYAGGSASIYRTWPEFLPASVEVWAVQLPGREARIAEPPFISLETLIPALTADILPHTDRPYAFFGHSMGALVSFELARELRRRNAPGPVHLFVSGRRAPQLPPLDPPVHALPEEQFVQELRTLNGTPAEVLTHPELLQLLLPMLRADFQVCETHRYLPEPPLGCAITAFGGIQDERAPRADLLAWQEQTTGAFGARFFPGGHFFIHSERSAVMQALSGELHRIAAEGHR